MTVLSAKQRSWLDRALISITAAEAGPSARDLKHAPELDLWRPQITVIGELVLEGSVCGHPTSGNKTIITSPVIALDPNHRWARTIRTAIDDNLTAGWSALAGHLILPRQPSPKNPDNSCSMFWSARWSFRSAAQLRSVRALDSHHSPHLIPWKMRFPYFQAVIHIHEHRDPCFQLRGPLPCPMII